MALYRLNEEKNGIEIVFEAKPAEDIREALKASGFRWGRGYWYAKQTPERLALAQKIAEGEAPKAEKKTAGTPQSHIKIYYNGLKVDGGALIKCNICADGETVIVYADGYGATLPRDMFQVKNDTDYYTDYFDTDSTTIDPSHPLHKYFIYAARKSAARLAKRHLEWLEKRGYASRPSYAGEIARSKKQIADFEAMTDPGQPTADDLEKINAQREAEENARREEEHKRELEERERVIAETIEGREYIEKVAKEYPIEEGAPTVTIPFSENPAFYSFMREDRKKMTCTINADGTTTTTEEIIEPAPRCVLSLRAADEIIRHFDIKKAAENKGYDKTDFIITCKDPETGEETTYEGRYDLGDLDGGLLAHMKAFAEWERRTGHGDPDNKAAFISYLEKWFVSPVVSAYLESVNGYTEQTPEGVKVFPLGGEPFIVEDLEAFCREELTEQAKSLAEQGEDVTDILKALAS